MNNGAIVEIYLPIMNITQFSGEMQIQELDV